MTRVVDERLEPDRAEIGRARRMVVEALRDLDEETREDVALCVSELVTNALLHGEPPMRLLVDVEPERVRVTVEDAARMRPVLVPVPGEQGGMGLRVVDGLSAGWKARTLPDGKAVWADVARAHRDA